MKICNTSKLLFLKINLMYMQCTSQKGQRFAKKTLVSALKTGWTRRVNRLDEPIWFDHLNPSYIGFNTELGDFIRNNGKKFEKTHWMASLGLIYIYTINIYIFICTYLCVHMRMLIVGRGMMKIGSITCLIWCKLHG